ncbi:hypothetical protein Q5762_19625 [Streptomyces sp. P9(2023)]|uniref:hypothetical protein n=1 Tax=Streptomyces sp. P9(2023) TaxID=3064394 RepID=UPI0028F4603B|nr:hypothetical protein [Streptomyces sp. P9(2023)]MDT9690510.1 hypothetical protein [Streptomyces sp. P9(2023)]
MERLEWLDYTPGELRKHRRTRSVWTSLTGWGMAVSVAGAIGCVLWGVAPYPPLYAEMGFAALFVLFAAAWIVSSRRAPGRNSYWRRRGPVNTPLSSEYLGRAPVWLLAWLVPPATLACLAMGLMVSPEYGRETARLNAARYGEHPATVVRLAGDPVQGDNASDEPVFFHTDLVLRIPYDSGPREVTMAGMYTRNAPPKTGMTIEVYYAPGDPRPDSPVLTDGRRDRPGVFHSFTVFGFVLVIPAGALLTGALGWELTPRVRRFTPDVHLPAFGIVALGLLLLLPTAIGWEAAGLARPAAFLACVTPGAALAWAWRTAGGGSSGR